MSEARHTYRYPEERYRWAMARAAAEGTTVTGIIIERLDEYVDTWDPNPRPDPDTAYNRLVEATHGALVIDHTTPVRVTEPVLENPVKPACRAVVRDGPCGCLRFRPQRNSPLRCEECGHVRGVHES